MVEILNKFCSKDVPAAIRVPWSFGGHSYASNGHILCRVPRQEGITEIDSPLDVGPLFSAPLPAKPYYLSDISLPEEERTDCSECHGTGETRHEECDCCDGHPCEECDGSGTVVKRAVVGVGKSCFDSRYLRVLQSLPGCVLYPNDDPLKTAAFTFDGGDGRIMPMKRASVEVYV